MVIWWLKCVCHCAYVFVCRITPKVVGRSWFNFQIDSLLDELVKFWKWLRSLSRFWLQKTLVVGQILDCMDLSNSCWQILIIFSWAVTFGTRNTRRLEGVIFGVIWIVLLIPDRINPSYQIIRLWFWILVKWMSAGKWVF